MAKKQRGGVNISGSTVTGGNIAGGDQQNVGGDAVSGDKITMGDVGAGAAVAAGRGAQASVTMTTSGTDFAQVLAEWRKTMEQKIDAKPDASADDKKDLKDQVEKIKTEAAKGAQADPSRLEKLINTLAPMGNDIFEVVMTTLQNPLSGIGLVLKKINDKAKVEKAAQGARQ
jgi:hypothetical protein